MAHTSEEQKKIESKRKQLQKLLDFRQKQENTSQKNGERIFVPVDINYTDIEGNNLLDYAVKLGEM